MKAWRLVGLVALPFLGMAVSSMADDGCDPTQPGRFTTLMVEGKEVKTYRDGCGIPHIFADTNHGLFVGYGYAVAQDRLWQLELNRRGARGRLAEIFGSSAVNADTNARILGYTSGELDAQFASLNAEEQDIFNAYAEGINRYLKEVGTNLPYEFRSLGIGMEPWSVQDSVAFIVRLAASPPASGQSELTNQSLLSALVGKYGHDGGLAVFNDLRWLNDPDTPVSIPSEGANGERQKAIIRAAGLNAQLHGASGTAPETLDEEAQRIWQALGIPTKLGSHGWVVSAANSLNASAMLFGGPALDTADAVPSNIHEVQLTGGNGFHMAGMAYAGVPLITTGRTDHLAWTVTTGAAVDNVDTYVETLCVGDPNEYSFNGRCIPFTSRVEKIQVQGGSTVEVKVQRSVHGPVVGPGPGGTSFSRKRAYEMREIESARGFLALNRAHNPREFEAGVDQVVSGFNFLYADRQGNIRFWQAGHVPVRPAGFDPRLPLPGDGTANGPEAHCLIPVLSIPHRVGWPIGTSSRRSTGTIPITRPSGNTTVCQIFRGESKTGCPV
jgi:penicillin G amidase